jgi:hypothetical protein
MALRVTGVLRAFAILRWRLFVNQLRGRRRDSFEQVSRISRLLVAATIAVTFIPASILLAMLAFIGGRGLAQGNPKADAVLIGARAVIALVTVVVAISPMLRFGSAPTSSVRTALLPVPRALLHAADLVSQLADPWILAITPALLAFPAGFLAGARAGAALFVLALDLVLLLFLASLGSALSLLAALIFRNRRIGELATVGVLVLISAAAMAPAMLIHGNPAATKGSIALFTAGRGAWLDPMPWTLYARATEELAAGPALGLLGIATVLFGVSRYAFGRLLDTPPSLRGGSSRAATLAKLPGLTRAASAIAWTTWRLAARSVRGRVILFSSPVSILMLALLWKRSPMAPEWTTLTGLMVFGVGSTLTLFSLQTLNANQFAVDRAGLTMTFLGPATARDIVFGKAAGGALVFASPLGAALAIAVAMHPHGAVALWFAAGLLALAAYSAERRWPRVRCLSCTVRPDEASRGEHAPAGRRHRHVRVGARERTRCRRLRAGLRALRIAGDRPRCLRLGAGDRGRACDRGAEGGGRHARGQA